MFNAYKAQLFVWVALGFGISGSAYAYSGYDRTVVNLCSKSARPNPVFNADKCSSCHASDRKSPTPAKTAYVSGGKSLLDFFCAGPAITNHAPVVSVPSNTLSVNTGSTVSFKVTAQDQDVGDTVTLSAHLAGVPGATFDPVTGQFSWLAGAAQSTAYSVVFKATDKAGLVSSTTIAITVHTSNASNNTAPGLMVPLMQQNVTIGQGLIFEIKASDIDGDDVQITTQSLPAGASLSTTTQNMATGEWVSVFSWIPEKLPATNPLMLTFTATDVPVDTASALSVSKSVKIQVNPNNGVAIIGSLNISKAKWESGDNRLEVAGVITPLKGQRLPKNLTVRLADANSAELIAAAVRVNKKGLWKFKSAEGALASQPCMLTAQSGGLTASIEVDRSCSIQEEVDDHDDEADEREEHENEDRDESGKSRFHQNKHKKDQKHDDD